MSSNLTSCDKCGSTCDTDDFDFDLEIVKIGSTLQDTLKIVNLVDNPDDECNSLQEPQDLTGFTIEISFKTVSSTPTELANITLAGGGIMPIDLTVGEFEFSVNTTGWPATDVEYDVLYISPGGVRSLTDTVLLRMVPSVTGS